MTVRRPPRVAQFLLRFLVDAAYRESLEGDLMEEFAAGRSRLWYWQQTLCAMREHLRAVARQQAGTFIAATAFFLLALWVIAPATHPVVGWARTAEPLHTLVLLCWLIGVPMVLGGVAGATERQRRIGAILLGATLAWLTPLTQPFDSAVCDLCLGPNSNAVPAAALFLTPFGSALLAGLGAWITSRIRHPRTTEQDP
jgi:O-antigen/teichoic acid export membrane protein